MLVLIQIILEYVSLVLLDVQLAYLKLSAKYVELIMSCNICSQFVFRDLAIMDSTQGRIIFVLHVPVTVQFVLVYQSV